MHGTRNCLAALLILLAMGAAVAETPLHWSAGAPMPSARAEIAVAELGGKVYVVGAFTGERELEIYDAAANRWSRGAPLPHSVHHPAAAAVNGKIYAIKQVRPIFVEEAAEIVVITVYTYYFDQP